MLLSMTTLKPVQVLFFDAAASRVGGEESRSRLTPYHDSLWLCGVKQP